ncbi:hypothetical protein L6164_024427 [Bauhinia variegata]|uniref:Uncharacterized protein n=1 Tax=Bauhinia variegata TaxID=167791 RepID=A0ACB9LYF4_BAUVA|nr:hypothetical protein L6164_024427 [Bauhinia variegata]
MEKPVTKRRNTAKDIEVEEVIDVSEEVLPSEYGQQLCLISRIKWMYYCVIQPLSTLKSGPGRENKTWYRELHYALNYSGTATVTFKLSSALFLPKSHKCIVLLDVSVQGPPPLGQA